MKSIARAAAPPRRMRAVGCAALLTFALVQSPGCSLGQGTGCFTNSSLDAPSCWSGPFDLQPNFFAAIPTNDAALELRIQNGIDNETFSDGIILVVDDVGEVRGDPLPDGTPRPSLLGQPIAVAMSPAAAAPGVPVKAVANPAVVHAAVYLNRTCRTQNVALYAMDAVSLEADGTCNRPDGGEPPLRCGVTQAVTPVTPAAGGDDAATTASGDATVDATVDDAEGGVSDSATPVPATPVAPTTFCDTCPCPDGGATNGGGSAGSSIGTSMIRFNHLFDGNAAESNAQQRLTDADFDLYLGDPREACPGGLGPPPRCRGHLQGHFQFYFQRGRPAQPFP